MTDTNCAISCEQCNHYRRCFMSGEYCSKQQNIRQERKRLHEKNEINAFVIMHFSDMSNVVYEWRLKSYIESLTEYLFINTSAEKIQCASNAPTESGWEKVTKINVLRADSDLASNYVICDRVCQQIQIADLVIVDVTDENTNVFYEFGMAVALGKLILPICYDRSFFAYEKPKKNEERKTMFNDELKLEKHIDCFPWRRRLFEHFGLKYREATSQVQYFNYKIAVDTEDKRHENHFSDELYKRFPYDSTYNDKGNGNYEKGTDKDKRNIGQVIYDLLMNSYNGDESTNNKEKNKPEDNKFGAKGALNTIVIYTMDNFINREQAATCIINFHKHITSKVRKMDCFCGDRVVTMVPEHAIREIQIGRAHV